MSRCPDRKSRPDPAGSREPGYANQAEGAVGGSTQPCPLPDASAAGSRRSVSSGQQNGQPGQRTGTSPDSWLPSGSANITRHPVAGNRPPSPDGRFHQSKEPGSASAASTESVVVTIPTGSLPSRYWRSGECCARSSTVWLRKDQALPLRHCSQINGHDVEARGCPHCDLRQPTRVRKSRIGHADHVQPVSAHLLRSPMIPAQLATMRLHLGHSLTG